MGETASNSSSNCSLGQVLESYRKQRLEEAQKSRENLPSTSYSLLEFDTEPWPKRAKKSTAKRVVKKTVRKRMNRNKSSSPRTSDNRNVTGVHSNILRLPDVPTTTHAMSSGVQLDDFGFPLSDDDMLPQGSQQRKKQPRKMKTSKKRLIPVDGDPYNFMQGMSESERKRFIRRQELLFNIQHKNLTTHPETIVNDIDDSKPIVPPPVLLEDKRAWVQNFIDTMAVDRVDYDKPRQVNIIEGISHKRASDVHFNVATAQLADSLDAKTILERVDFEKEQERMKNILLEHTSTPKPTKSSPQSVMRVVPSTSKQPDLFDDDVFRDKSHIFTSTRIGSILDDSDISNLDRSNVTIRTPRSKLVEASSCSKKNPMEEGDLMNFVEQLLAEEERTINEHPDELSVQEREKRIQESLDQIILINSRNNSNEEQQNPVVDNSVEIIEAGSLNNDSVQIIESSEVEFAEPRVIEIIDIPSNSPVLNLRSRTLRSQTKASKRRHALPAIAEGPAPKRSSNETAAESSDVKPTTAECKTLRECPICLEPLGKQEISATICGHIFCTTCIKQAIKSTKRCPNCRSSLSLKKIHPLFL